MKNIAVVFGGKSVEHDISIITALQVMSHMPKNYNIIPIYIKPDGEFVTADNLKDKNVYLNYSKLVKNEKDVCFMPASESLVILKSGKIKKEIKIDCSLLCNHGHGGEDGCLQGYLEMCQIPYTSCSVVSSAICMDKVLTKIILKDADIDTPAYVHFNQCEFEANCDKILDMIAKKIKFPCIIKPARLGSSVGISICEHEANLKEVIEHALKFDDKIIVEKFIANAREFCCAVLKVRDTMFESRLTEVEKSQFFTFEEKYLKEKSKENKQISKILENKIKRLAKASYKALSCDGVVRIDFLYSEENEKLYVNEVNTIPGSLAFNLFDTTFGDFLNTLILEAIRKKEKDKGIVYKFNSSAIEKYVSMSNSFKSKS